MPVAGSFFGDSNAFEEMAVEVAVTFNAAPARESRARNDNQRRRGD